MTPHPRHPDGPCEEYKRGHAALPGKGPREIQAELGIPRGCEFCGARAVELVAALAADPDQRICAECHADPRLPTVASDPFEGIPNADDKLYALPDPAPDTHPPHPDIEDNPLWYYIQRAQEAAGEPHPSEVLLNGQTADEAYRDEKASD